MKNLVLILLLSFIIGCASAGIDNQLEGNYRYFSSAEFTFDDYSILVFRKEWWSKSIYILSKKSPTIEIDTSVYTDLVEGRLYNLKFKEMQSPIILHSKNKINQILVDDSTKTILWSNDTLYMKVYSSDDINGTYVRKSAELNK